MNLKQDPHNARKHSQRNLSAVGASLKELGAGRSIVVDRNGVVIAGNATLEQAQALGLKTHVVHTKGDRLVVVVRDDLKPDDPRRKALALADNRAAELGEWDDSILQAAIADLTAAGNIDLDALALAELAALQEEGKADADPQMDRAAELCTKWQVKPGDLWLIGDHRLLCGDCTKPADVARAMGGDKPLLMVTDPPYGVEYDPTWRDSAGGQFGDGKTVMRGKVENDDRCDWREAWALFSGEVAYVWHASLRCAEVLASLQSAGFGPRAQIIWRKQHFTLMRTGYHWQHEPCWYCVRTGGTAHWAGDRCQTTVWDIESLNAAGRKGDKEDQEEKVGHGTQKPVECMARPIRNHDAPEVYDPFLGSGTTMVACQNLGRRCRALEIHPPYVAVTLGRMTAAFPGIAIRKAT